MNKNEEIDQMIKEALSEDEIALFNSYDEQNLFQKFGGLFQGKMKWINTMTLIVQFIMFGLAIYCGYRSFYAIDTIQMIQFGAGAFFLMMAVTALKFFQFMEIHKNEVIREIKRVELQVSLLASRKN